MIPRWQEFDNGKIAKLPNGRHLAWPNGMTIDSVRNFSTYTEAGTFLDRIHDLRMEIAK